MISRLFILFWLGVTPLLFAQNDFSKKLSVAALELTTQQVQYDSRYFSNSIPKW
jgi:hypothetical protein